jgi:tetratricopeptide (TPR) repeat protein
MASALRGEEIVPTANYGATDDPFLSNGWSPLRSLNDGRWKYIRTTRVELYDLANDPAELHDLAESEPEQRKKMAALMAEFEGRLAPRSEVEVQLSPAERQTLASLGYAAGATRAAPGDGATDRAAIAELPDVKDMLPLDRAADEADRLIVGGNVDAGIARLREIVQKAPGLTKAYWNLAFALRKKGELNEASAVFQKLLDARPHAREAHQGLGILALDEGRIDDAIAEFRQTVDIDPDFADVHYNLAVAYLRKKKPLEALSHLNQLLEIDTFHAKGYDLRGDVLAGLGRKDEAIADYQRALKYGVPKE